MSLDPGFGGVLAAAQEGAEWAWELLVRDLSPRLVGFFRVRGVGDPEDLAGEVFHDVARGIQSFHGDEARFRSWVFVIAHRRLIDARRRAVRRREEPRPIGELDDGETPSAEVAAMIRIGTEEVRRVLAALTPAQAEVLALRVVAGLSLQETAAVMGKKVGAIKALQRRALASARREISKRGVSQ